MNWQWKVLPLSLHFATPLLLEIVTPSRMASYVFKNYNMMTKLKKFKHNDNYTEIAR